MPDPIRTDAIFQETIEAIETAKSYRYIFFRFRQFVSILDGEFRKYQSYLFQLFDELPVYTLPLMWSGLDPAQIRGDADLLQKISEELSTDICEEVIVRLRQVAFLQYICLSEPNRANEQFEHLFERSLFKEEMADLAGSTCDNLSLTRELLTGFTEGLNLNMKQKKAAATLHSDIKRLLQRGELEALIPVAEDNDGTIAGTSGRLRKVTLVKSDENSSRDVIIRYFPVIGAEPVSGIDTTVVTTRARMLAEEKSAKLKGNFFNARLHYEINGAEHAGESANLALSALWYAFLLKQADLRERYTVAGDAAITGNISKEGKVLPVDPGSVKAKAEAVFFSWANLMAVPISQYSLFSEQILRLKERYPGRKISLIGVEKLDDLFFDRRLTYHHEESRIAFTYKKFKREKFKVIGIPLIVVLLLIIARLVYGPVDQNPVIVDYEGSKILLKNASGLIVSELEVGEESVEYYENSESLERRPLFHLVNINGDDKNELIYSNFTNRHMSASSYVRAWSVSGDSLIWERELTFEYDYPEHNAFLNSSLRVREIQVIETPRGVKLAVSAIPNQYFHNIVNIYDLHTGIVEQELIHPGRIFDMYVVDVDGDKFHEIILTGVNNAYWKAAIMVLEYNIGSRGYAPATKSYQPAGLELAELHRYMLIPKSFLAAYFEPLQKYNVGSEVTFDAITENVFFEIIEGRRFLNQYENDISLYYYFDINFEPLGIGTSDTYDVAARDFFLEGKIPFEPDYEYFEALQDSILYWNGEEFIPTREYFSTQSR